jgi:hypothetical protein
VRVIICSIEGAQPLRNTHNNVTASAVCLRNDVVAATAAEQRRLWRTDAMR